MLLKVMDPSHSWVVKVFIMRKELVWAAAVELLPSPTVYSLQGSGIVTTPLLHAWLVVKGAAGVSA